MKEDRYIELTAGVAITQINLNYDVYDSGGIFLSNESATPTALTLAFGGVWHFAPKRKCGCICRLGSFKRHRSDALQMGV